VQPTVNERLLEAPSSLGKCFVEREGCYLLYGEVLPGDVEAGKEWPVKRVEARQKDEVGVLGVDPQWTPEVIKLKLVPVGGDCLLLTRDAKQKVGVTKVDPKDAHAILDVAVKVPDVLD
jgi:hypothetical protein